MTTPLTVKASDDAELAVWCLGSEEAAGCVLLLHGFSLDHSTWLPVAESLAAEGFRTVIPDLRGHGQSDLGSATPDLTRLVDDVALIIDALELSPVHLVGHSLGAVIALHARTNLPQAELLSVTSVAGTERSIQNPVMKLGAKFFSSTVGIKILRTQRFGRLMISTWFGKNPDRAQMDWIRLLSADCARSTRQRISEATSQIDLRDSLSIAGLPTMFMVGKRDQATPAKISKRMASAVPAAVFEEFEGAGHMLPIEQPEAVAERLRAWFGEVARQAG